MFCLYLIPIGLKQYFGAGISRQHKQVPGDSEADQDGSEDVLLVQPVRSCMDDLDKLSIRQSIRLSAEFCLLWFFANYFNSFCLKFTSVASATILSSTSATFTLILGAYLNVDTFTPTKLISVLASLIGISLISTTDLLPAAGPSHSSLTSRTPLQVLLGDGMALLSAFFYGAYITLLKHRVGSEKRINMQLFFGFVGLLNVVFMWPGLLLLHVTGTESFQLPPDRRVWAVVLLNAAITLTSDFCWAYAMLLTTPLIVTVGLSLAIPLALVGQMVLLGSVAGVWYWVGAACVFLAFWVVSKDQQREEAGVVDIPRNE